MSVRVAHLTDLHWFSPPRLGDLCAPKRLLGSANLYLRGRRADFPAHIQDAAVAHVASLSPDLVVITGDLTATALDAEFAAARVALAPLLDRFPTLILPGNHDRYTRGSDRSDRMRVTFGAWFHSAAPTAPGDRPLGRIDVGALTCISLDPTRPTGLSASGEVPGAQLVALADLLRSDALDGRTLVLALHYPILDRRGGVYDGWAHGLRNARALIQVLADAPRRPVAILHGHEHHGFTVPLPLPGGAVPIFNCGSSGYAWKPEKRRAAAINLYTVGDTTEVSRYLYDGAGFQPEAGGAYATGR